MQLPCSFHAFTVHLLDTSCETRREGIKTIGLKMRHGGKALKPLVETRETRRDALLSRGLGDVYKRQLHGSCMASAWQLRGSCMATAWQLRSENHCGCSGTVSYTHLTLPTKQAV